MLRTLFALTCLAGCCDQAEDCPDQAVVVFVTEDGAAVEGVTVSGDLELVCEAGESETACTPTATVTDGDYALTVQVPGRAPIDVELSVETDLAPPFSCECEVRGGAVTIELEPAAPSDAGI